MKQRKCLRTFALLIILVINLTAKGQYQNHNWQGFGSGKSFGLSEGINTIFYDSIDDILYAGGHFVTINDTIFSPCVTFWDGTKWNGLDSGAYNWVHAITRYQDKIYVGGQFKSVDYDNVPAIGIATWDGNQWDSLPIPLNIGSQVHGFKTYNNELYVFGGFDTIGNVAMNSLAKWDGNQWSDVFNFPYLTYFPSIQGIVDVEFCHGNIYAGGEFYNSATTNIRDIVMYDGINWKALGTPPGMYGGINRVHDMEVYQGDLYVVGSIYKSAGNVGNFIQRWDGNQWHEVGGSLWGTQARCLLARNEYLYVGGEFGWAGEDTIPAYSLARWDGKQWCAYDSYIDGSVGDIEFYRDTMIIAGGFITIAGDTMMKIAKYTGGNWVDYCGKKYGEEEAEEEIIANPFSLYPNPNNGIFTLETTNFENTTVTVYNITGQLILKGMLSQPFTTINLSEFSKGLYFLKVETPSETITEKIVYQ